MSIIKKTVSEVTDEMAIEFFRKKPARVFDGCFFYGVMIVVVFAVIYVIFNISPY